MSNLLDRVAARLGFSRAAPVVVRKYEAAIVDRLTASWRADSASIDRELRSDLNRLRHRSRDLFRNNEYAKKFGRMVATNIVGQGFTLQSRPMEGRSKVDQLAADAIEAAWADFSKPANCDVRGKTGLAGMFRLAALAVARDGEAMIRVVAGRGKYGLQLQQLDIERLDTEYNRGATVGTNEIVMGIELDADKAPVAYHLFTGHPNGSNEASRSRARVPAAEILHFFLPDDLEQSRGVPWMHAAMRRLNDLGGYREAAVIAARIGASKMGFYKTPEGDLAPMADGTTTGAGGAEQYMTQAEPGEFGRLPPGWEFQSFDPAYPHEQFDAFTKACLRGIASAMGVSYNSLANDLEGVNFSSIRSGVLEERDQWMVLQDWFIEQAVEPIFERWIETALLAGAIKQMSSNGPVPLPAAKKEKFSEHLFQGRRWGWVDPVRDVQASILAIEANLTTATDVAARSGVDYQDVLATKQREKELLAAYGLDAPTGNSQVADKPAARSFENETDELEANEMRQLMQIARRGQAAGQSVELALRVEPAAPPPVIQVAAPIVNVASPTVNVAAPSVTVENIVQPAAVQAPEVRVEVAAPAVSVSPQVYFEATMPAPEVRVDVQLPARRTDTVIERDQSGRIARTTQIESDI